MSDFVPSTFTVPLKYDTELFHFHKLTPDDAQKDYAAVMAAREFIRTLYGIEDPGEWPTEELTFEEDVQDLVKHADEFDKRLAFAYCVMSPSGHACLGCVYIDPSDRPPWDAIVRLWGLDQEITDKLYTAVRQFVDGEFCYRNPAFPVFEIPLNGWRNQPGADK